MAESEDEISDRLRTVLKEPKRDFQTDPLRQDEIMAIVETLLNEVNDPELDEQLGQYYISIIEFLKTKILFN